MFDNFQKSSRREWLKWSSYGLTGAVLTDLFASEIPLSKRDVKAHYPAKAKRVIHICLMGGLSQIDSFDYKPELARAHGKSLQYTERPATFFNRIGLIRKNDWDFQQRGKSGLWVSDLFHISLEWRMS